MNVPDKSTFASIYAGQPPWDIGKPQQPFIEVDRRNYVEGLATVLKRGGRLFLMCFSDEEPGTQGPRRISQKELRDAFAKGWTIESIQPVRIEVAPNIMDFTFSEGGPKGWFAIIRRAS
jgi:Thiopurine S-methyltransferase (TPMT)